MEWSIFGEELATTSGIGELMDDLVAALQGSEKKYMLGGGNPGQIPAVNRFWRKRMQEIMDNSDQFERIIALYDTPQGNEQFLKTMAAFLIKRYDWQVGPENIAITNGSQNAFYTLFNMLAGPYRNGQYKKIVFPLCPEYIGYADQGVHPAMFTTFKPCINEIDEHTFKYYIDFGAFKLNDDVGAICVSRPTNPTGNVLTNDEILRLDSIARAHGVPLMIDNAYGLPFPNIIFNDIEPIWNPNIILGISLSKLGLPSLRTGILVADAEIIEAVSKVNAIMNLASNTLGQALVAPLVNSGEIVDISTQIVMPYYRKKGEQALAWIRELFDGINYSVHKMEGAFFLWMWLKDLSISDMELYERLKKRDVIIVPGHYFFYGIDGDWPHVHQCIRISYAQEDGDVLRGLEIIAEEIHACV